jgi:hypothetical protein
MVNQRSKEERAELLTDWIGYTISDHGHGPIIGCKTLRALGLLKRQNVEGCRHTEENVACAQPIKDHILFMSESNWKKRHRETPDGPVVPVLDANGDQIVGTSRVVLVDPDSGAQKLMTWFLERPECLLRRLIQQRPQDRILHRLAGRYSFMKCDNNALGELNEKERNEVIRMEETDEGWKVSCEVTRPKSKKVHTATGKGRRLEEAFYDLADRYYEDSNQPA